MPKLIIVSRDGRERTVEGKTGRSVMEVIRENGIDELLALCGGCCSCATCHVHIDPDWTKRVGPPSPDEDELLDLSDDRANDSRLSCQIEFGEALDGLRVIIAEED